MTAQALTVLWRGPLSGCNYACPYCPFAKHKDSREILQRDAQDLQRFCDWALSRNYPLEILFTPWGEGLIRKTYQQAIIRLSHAAHIQGVAIQTNLSAPLGFLNDADLSRAALWATYHPGETLRAAFLKKVNHLVAIGARFSVGMVALRDYFDEAEAMRAALPEEVYLWLNAEESLQGQYTDEEVQRLTRIDPLFELNNRAYASLGRSCGAGSRAISVNGAGDARPCHFVDGVIGNIYDADFETRLLPRACPKATCNCHIGYAQLDALDVRPLFDGGFIERRAAFSMRDAAQATRRLQAFDQVSTTGR